MSEEYSHENPRNDDYAEKEKSLKLLLESGSKTKSDEFWLAFPDGVRGFVSSIIQNSLIRVYDKTIGVSSSSTTDDPCMTFPPDPDNPKDFEAHYLIDLAMEKVLTPIVASDDETWRPKAQMEDTPCLAPNIEWPSNAAFNIPLGLTSIEQFIKSWELSCGWLHAIDNLPTVEEPYWINYNYDVRCSIPTRRTPVPRQTVSVYFTLRKSKYKPGSFPVEVFYVIESFSQVHRPGQHVFNEEWLKQLLEQKTKFAESITF